MTIWAAPSMPSPRAPVRVWRRRRNLAGMAVETKRGDAAPRNDASLKSRYIKTASPARTSHGTLVQEGSRRAAAWRRRGVSRRRHFGRHQGAAAIGRELRRRLSGRAGVASARRHGRCRGFIGRARRTRRDLHQRGRGRGHAGRLDQLSAARRGDLEVDRRHQCGGRCAVEPRLARRRRWHPDRARRGLRRRRQRHTGALLRLRDEVVDLAARSAARFADHRPYGRTGIRSLRSQPRASDARSAGARLPSDRRIRRQGQQDRRLQRPPSARRPPPPRFDYGRLTHPPVTFIQERLKVEERLPAAQQFIRERKLNEMIPGDCAEVGVIVLGGLTNTLLRALARLDLADLYGASRIPIYVLNVAYPLLPDEVKTFCAGKRAVLVVEEGSPDYVEQQINAILRGADIQTRILGKGCLPRAGEYVSEVVLRGLAAFFKETRPHGIDADALVASVDAIVAPKPAAAAALGDIPPRPPNFCTGCPERPVFAAIKLAQRELGPTHISADIGCHSFATFAPFSLGNSILGYGMSLASAAAVGPNMAKRPIAIMGDGGFWHNGLITGVASSTFNNSDGVLIVMQNGYASATGQQYLPSSAAHRSGRPAGISIEKAVRALGVKWLRTVRTYSVAKMVATLKEAMRTAERGLKVIIADGECMLARQRRLRVENAEKLKRGERVVRTRYGVDDEICTGDHSCIRLSGCPSLTVKPNPDPLRTDPVATVIESCVGCGLCGEVAHAAVLCPSLYRAEIVRNATWRDRFVHRLRQKIIGWLGGYSGKVTA